MAQHIDNMMGEQGGVYITAAGTDEYTAGDFTGPDDNPVEVKLAVCMEDGTTLTSINQPRFTNSAAYLPTKTYTEGSIIWGKIDAMKVATGGFQLFFHRRTS